MKIKTLTSVGEIQEGDLSYTIPYKSTVPKLVKISIYEKHEGRLHMGVEESSREEMHGDIFEGNFPIEDALVLRKTQDGELEVLMGKNIFDQYQK